MKEKDWPRGKRKTAAALVLVLLASALFTAALWWASQRRAVTIPDRMELRAVTEEQSLTLQKLCKVWGYAKYYHPALATGTTDCDRELLKLIPEILPLQERDADALLLDWLESLGEAPAGTPPDFSEIFYSGGDTGGKNAAIQQAALVPDTEWIEALSPPLSSALTSLSQTYITDRGKGPMSIDQNGFVTFDHEKPYPVIYASDGSLRLLSLFRYWNIIAYFYPYREIPGENWDDVLAEFIPKFAAAEEDLSYKLAVAELTARIHDTHAYVEDKSGTLARYRGTKRAPVSFLNIGGRIVISEIGVKYALTCPLKPGDVVLRLDGRDIDQVVAEKLKYSSLSNDGRIVKSLKYDLFATQNNSIVFTVERDGEILELPVKCTSSYFGDRPRESHRLLDGNIGLINPGALARGEIRQIMKEFEDTAGLIVDLRQYPSDFIVFSLAEYLMPEPDTFANVAFSAPGIPGQFSPMVPIVNGTENPDHYKGKVVLLMDERTLSQAEYTVMALRRRAAVVGSGSNGADGNVITFSLPGNIETAITGLGVYNPDGSPTQRVGLAPDVEAFPTVEGLRAGRDELLEKAVALIEG